MTKMYRVEIVAYVCAESESAAKYVSIDTSACDVEVSEAISLSSGWWGDVYPFGEDKGKTCEQWMREQRG
jgi:hypothetical protein